MKSLLDRTFRYTPSVETDLKKTFDRIRRQLKAEAHKEAEERERVAAERERKVKPMRSKA